MRGSVMCVVLLVLSAVPAPRGGGMAAAQQRPPADPPAVRPAAVGDVGFDYRVLASAVVPGSAQYLAGDDRWVPYIAVEAWGWISYLQQRQAALDAQERYRQLAQVARRISGAVRRDTVFEYYEAMANPAWPASGAFDVEPTREGVQPERRRGTFNGDLWQLATALFIPGGGEAVPGAPGYDAALAYYIARAIPPGYAWAWGASNLEQQVFADLITESDAAFRTATRFLGLILANHVVSAVDALVTHRLRQLSGHDVRFETVPVRDPNGMRWQHGITIRF
ncbi:hypothetical protein BH23GEM10_BH23GEM10_12860 [soil metagenome]